MVGNKPRILCVDDDPDILAFLEIALSSAGYGFTGADSAEAGLRLFEEVAPALVIIDLMMEEVDAGALFVRELRARRSDVPIFMLSSVGDDLSAAIDTGALGISGVFQKPLAKERLLAVIEAKLGH